MLWHIDMVYLCLLASSDLPRSKPAWKKQYALTQYLFHYIPNKLSPMHHYFSPKQNIYVVQCSILFLNIWCNTKIAHFPFEAYQLTSISVYARAAWSPLNSMLRRILGNNFLIFNLRSKNFVSYHSFLKTTFISNSQNAINSLYNLKDLIFWNVF